MCINFLKPIGYTAMADTRCASGIPLTQNIVSWCKDVTLGGNSYDLDVDTRDVYQISSPRLNWHAYGVSVNDPKLVRDIVLEAKSKEKDLGRNIGGELNDLDVVGGVLTLHRHIFHHPAPRVRGRWDPRRFKVEDSYCLDVYCRNRMTPVVTVYRDSLGFFHAEAMAEEIAQEIESPSTYYPEPDDIIVNWHQLANILDLQRTQLYVQACVAAAGFRRPVYGYNGPSLPPRTRPRDIGADLLFPNRRYTLAELSTPGFVIPSWEATRSYDNLIVAALYAMSPHGADRVIPPECAVPSGEVAFGYDALRRIPQPHVDQSIESKAAITFLRQQSEGIAEYLDGDFFRMKADELTELATGTANGGSTEWAFVHVGAEMNAKSTANIHGMAMDLSRASDTWDLGVDRRRGVNSFGSSNSRITYFDNVRSMSEQSVAELQAAGVVAAAVGSAITAIGLMTVVGTIVGAIEATAGVAKLAVGVPSEVETETEI